MDLEKFKYSRVNVKIRKYGNYKEKVLNINFHKIKYETKLII